MTIMCQIQNMYTTFRCIELNFETNFEDVHNDISFPRVKTKIVGKYIIKKLVLLVVLCYGKKLV